MTFILLFYPLLIYLQITTKKQQKPNYSKHTIMKQQQQPLLLILVAASLIMSYSMMVVGAYTTTNDKTQHDERRGHLRALLLRGGGDRGANNDSSRQGDRKLDPSLSDFTSSLDLYQMETMSSSVQPLDDIVSDGARGQLIYSPSGWDFMFAFVGHNLPAGTAYQLVLRYPNNSITCLGTPEAVGQLGGLFIRGTVYIGTTLFKDGGAKVWLALASDVNCTSRSISPSNYNKYLFPKSDDSLEFDYLGDGV
jgi:hypothetical protein